MIFFILLLFNEAKNTKEKYGDCIALLSQKLPIDKNMAETKAIMKSYIQFFDRNPPGYKEKEQICNRNKNLFLQVGRDILNSVNLQNQITDKQMARCISRNLPLFAYTVIYMANGQYSTHIAKIKRDYLSEKANGHQNFARKVYITPQIPRPDLNPFFDFGSVFTDDQDDGNEILDDDDFLNGMIQNEYFNDF